MKFKFNPLYGIFEMQDTTTVESIESSKILPMVGSIPASSSGTIETVTYTNFFAIRYFVAIQSASGKTNAFDYIIANDGVGGLKQSVFGAVNGGLSLVVDSFVDSGSVKFTITNNELVAVTYKVHKLGF